MFAGGTFQASTAFVPNTDGGADLGSTTAKFADAYINTINGGALSLTGSTTMSLSNYADDAAAAAGGIGVGQLYRNGSVVQIRVS